MRNNSLAEKCVLRAQTGAVVELRRQQNVAWFVFLLQTTNRGNGNDPAHVERAQRVNIGPMIQFMRDNPVAAAMSRQKVNLPAAECAANQRVGRRTERCFNSMFGRVAQLLYLV